MDHKITSAPGDVLTAEGIPSLNNEFDAHVVISKKQQAVLTYSITRKGDPPKFNALKQRIRKLASLWPEHKPDDCTTISMIILEKLWPIRDFHSTHLKPLKERLSSIWCIYDNHTVPLSMTSDFDETEKFSLNDNTKSIDFEAVSSFTRDVRLSCTAF